MKKDSKQRLFEVMTRLDKTFINEEYGGNTDDPTKEEMVGFLTNEFQSMGSENMDFDIEAAIYWFGNDYHGGQSSNLYSALSTSPFRPGPSHRGIEDEESEIGELMYNELVNKYGGAAKPEVDNSQWMGMSMNELSSTQENLVDYFKNMWSKSEMTRDLVFNTNELFDKYKDYFEYTPEQWDAMSEPDLRTLWDEWSKDEQRIQDLKGKYDDVGGLDRQLEENQEEKTFMLDGESLPVHFKFEQYDKNGALAVELWDEEGPYATVSTNIPESSALPQDEFYLKHWGENEYLAQQLINKKIILPTGQQDENLGAKSYKIAPEYSQTSGI